MDQGQVIRSSSFSHSTFLIGDCYNFHIQALPSSYNKYYFLYVFYIVFLYIIIQYRDFSVKNSRNTLYYFLYVVLMNNPKFFIIFPLLLLYTIYYLFNALKSWELCQGFIINPWGKKLILPLEVIELLFTHKPTFVLHCCKTKCCSNTRRCY